MIIYQVIVMLLKWKISNLCSLLSSVEWGISNYFQDYKLLEITTILFAPWESLHYYISWSKYKCLLNWIDCISWRSYDSMDDMILFSSRKQIKYIKLKRQSISHVIMNSYKTLETCKIICKNVSWLRKKVLREKPPHIYIDTE